MLMGSLPEAWRIECYICYVILCYIRGSAIALHLPEGAPGQRKWQRMVIPESLVLAVLNISSSTTGLDSPSNGF